jgi:uncharacterized ubiquitin-like protein YukD
MANEAAILRSINKNQTNMKRLAIVASTEMSKVLSAGNNAAFLDQAGLIRTVTQPILEKYGAVAATLATVHFNEYRSLQTDLELPRYAPIAPVLDYTEEIDKVVGISIAEAKTKNYTTAKQRLLSSSNLILANWNRGTVEYHANNEPAKVVSIQRVAEPNACAFCLVVALNQYTYTISGNESLNAYKPEYHAYCQCSAEVIYVGQAPVYPSYYDNFNAIYQDAFSNRNAKDEDGNPVFGENLTIPKTGGTAGQKNVEAKKTFQAVRALTGRK